MIAIELAPTEVGVLRTVLESRLSGLVFEIDHTDLRAFREELRRQADIVERLLHRLPPASPASKHST
jgi:hypothetical protein